MIVAELKKLCGKPSGNWIQFDLIDSVIELHEQFGLFRN